MNTGEDRLQRLAALQQQASEKSKAAQTVKLERARAKEEKLRALEGKTPLARRKILERLELAWKQEHQKCFPDAPLGKWVAKHRGQAWNLVDRFDADLVEKLFVYAIRNWATLRERQLRGRAGPFPPFGLIVAMADTLIPEASLWFTHKGVLEEYASYGEYDRKPEDLRERYLKACEALKSLGLKT